MKKAIASAMVAGMVVAAAPAGATTDVIREPEGCQAFNPAQPTCSFTVVDSMEGPVAGVAGAGTWVVKIKRGKKKLSIKSPASGEPTAIEFLFESGDKVTATAVSPGAGLVVGGD